MAWRPTQYLLEGELNNTTPGKVTGWLRFAGMKHQVTFDLEGDFHRDIRGASIHLTGEGHAGMTYNITGPDLIDAEHRAAIFSQVGGKPVAVVQVDDEALAVSVSEAIGLPLPVAREMTGGIGRATRSGTFAVSSNAVEQLTGRAPITLRAALEKAKGSRP